MTVAGRAGGMATDTLAATMKVYNAAMGDRLADPDALIHDLRPNALMRISAPRWEANAGTDHPMAPITRRTTTKDGTA
jgi:hypothetical protein